MGAYNKTTFIEGVTPFTASFINTLQDWIETMDHAGVSVDETTGTVTMPKVQLTTGTIKRFLRFAGTGSQTLTHNFGETPDFYTAVYTQAPGQNAVPLYFTTATSTQVFLGSEPGIAWIAIVGKI